MERVLSFFILSDRLGYMGKTRWPHLFLFFLKEKINQQYICVNNACLLWIMVITMTDLRVTSVLDSGSWDNV